MRVVVFACALSVVVTEQLASQQSDVEVALLACKKGVIQEVLRTRGPTVSVVRFPPGATAWPIVGDGKTQVQGLGQYRHGPATGWVDFSYECRYDRVNGRASVALQKVAPTITASRGDAAPR